MHQTLELLPDFLSEPKILTLIERVSEGSGSGQGTLFPIQPHVTLLAAPSSLLADCQDAIAHVLHESLPLTLELSHFGVFPGATSTLFAGITPSEALLQLHRKLHETVGRDERIFPYYRPGNLVFHCTLREGLPPAPLSEFFASAGDVSTPGPCEFRTARLMAYASDSSLIRPFGPG